MSDSPDDLDSLFDEISAQRIAASEPGSAPTPASAGAGTPVDTTENAVIRADDPNNPMFERLGGIVRQLHDSLKELGYDQTLAERVGEIADSNGRLEYIATLTEQAANKVLNAIDVSMPEQDKLAASAKDIEARWILFFKGKLSIDEFKDLAGDSKNFASLALIASESEKARLMDIMMAQDFQDITGQIIKKVVGISQRLEQDLAQLLRDHAPHASQKNKEVDLMAGPSVPATAMVQDDVDDLLADLGF